MKKKNDKAFTNDQYSFKFKKKSICSLSIPAARIKEYVDTTDNKEQSMNLYCLFYL